MEVWVGRQLWISCAVGRILRVSSDFSINLFQSWSGNNLLVVHKPTMRWFLNILMDLFATLTHLFYGSTNWRMLLFLAIILQTLADALFSKIYRFGRIPRILKHA